MNLASQDRPGGGAPADWPSDGLGRTSPASLLPSFLTAAPGTFGSPACGQSPATSGAGVERLGNEVAASPAEQMPGDHSEGMF